MVTSYNFDTIDRRTKQVTPSLIDAVTSRIVHHLYPNQIFLFGSQARGNATKESDIDLLVILEDRHQLALLPHRQRAGKVLDLFRYRSFGLDALVLTEAEIQQLQNTNEDEWDLILEILKTGKPLYERATATAHSHITVTCTPR
jgi:predicted nucleotidyltransferase